MTPAIIHCTTQQMQQAIRDASAQQKRCDDNNWKPFGQGTIQNRIPSRLAELVFPAWYDGGRPQDPTYESEIKRGFYDYMSRDGIKWHIRSSRYYNGKMLAKRSDPDDAIYVFVDTSRAPQIAIWGWISKEHIIQREYPLEPMIVDPKRLVWNIPRHDLLPLQPLDTADIAA